MKSILVSASICGFVLVFASVYILVYYVKSSPTDFPTASAHTQPSYEQEFEVPNDDTLLLTVAPFNMEEIDSRIMEILGTIESQLEEKGALEIDESSGDSSLQSSYSSEYEADYHDEEFRASMDLVPVPVATIIEDTYPAIHTNDKALQFDYTDRSVRNSLMQAAFWNFSFIIPIDLAFENHVNQRFLDPKECKLLCERKEGCNAISVLRGFYSARCDLFNFPENQAIQTIPNKMGVFIDLRRESLQLYHFQHNIVIPGLSFKRLKTEDPFQCFDKCMEDRRCKAFFWREIDNKCSLKNHLHLNRHYHPNILSCDVTRNMVRASIPRWPDSVDFFVTSGIIRFEKKNNCPVNVSPIN
ncbi:Oidioi.mRNA.OKI2018_I69.PAR.g8995.t1.cds [Oikopleura dioica]|uniref:Oidioi.mRNA.OKI2018_I69.PAR.g8995.t1.cds n=1 Tax=Oikopleura dioica TaxID=34765 RepID=A0ABN7RIJ1_OIKDI|nr:Oidioi.mRNA.OKI2018_I69.PAR.g8995.t1.cds [Oikopleura dioica]